MKKWGKVALGGAAGLALIGADLVLTGGFFTACALVGATAAVTGYVVGKGIGWGINKIGLGINKIRKAFRSKKSSHSYRPHRRNLLGRPSSLKKRSQNRQRKPRPSSIEVDFDEKSRKRYSSASSDKSVSTDSSAASRSSSRMSKDSFTIPPRPSSGIPYVLHKITDDAVIVKKPVRNENSREYHMPIGDINNIDELRKNSGTLEMISFKRGENKKYDATEVVEKEIKSSRSRKGNVH